MIANEATVFDIQKYTVHDGPGIRTTVFFKGCPLRCLWCSNPEGLHTKSQVGVFHDKCIGLAQCGRCLTVCPVRDETLVFADNKLVGINRKNCRSCLRCASVCPNESLKIWGKKYTVPELVKIIAEDRSYFADSGGGVTLGGGDPLCQWEFVRDLLAWCHRYGIHTCVESELKCAPEALMEVLLHTDLLITDIKNMDAARHKAQTGVSNEQILANIKAVVASGTPTVLRTPVVPGYNDDDENVHATAQFISGELENRIRQYQLLPYRQLGTDKYAALGMPYPVEHIGQPPREEYEPKIRRMVNILREYGVPAVPGTNVPYDYR